MAPFSVVYDVGSHFLLIVIDNVFWFLVICNSVYSLVRIDVDGHWKHVTWGFLEDNYRKLEMIGPNTNCYSDYNMKKKKNKEEYLAAKNYVPSVT